MVEIEVQEDSGDDGRVGEESEDPHLSAATGTDVETVTACSVREEMRSGISIMRPRIVSSGRGCLSLVCF